MTKERNNLHRLMQKKKTVLRIPSFLYVLVTAYRTKSVCKNPYNTSKYLVL